MLMILTDTRPTGAGELTLKCKRFSPKEEKTFEKYYRLKRHFRTSDKMDLNVSCIQYRAFPLWKITLQQAVQTVNLSHILSPRLSGLNTISAPDPQQLSKEHRYTQTRAAPTVLTVFRLSPWASSRRGRCYGVPHDRGAKQDARRGVNHSDHLSRGQTSWFGRGTSLTDVPDRCT